MYHFFSGCHIRGYTQEGDLKLIEILYAAERMDELAKRKDERMEILNLLREKQISVAEALEKFRLMKEDDE